VCKEIKQIKYKNWGFDTCSKGMDIDLWNLEKKVSEQIFKYRNAKMLGKRRFKIWIKF
jgi:hypothetical protein